MASPARPVPSSGKDQNSSARERSRQTACGSDARLYEHHGETAGSCPGIAPLLLTWLPGLGSDSDRYLAWHVAFAPPARGLHTSWSHFVPYDTQARVACLFSGKKVLCEAR